jgi:hypothetical protein
MPTTLRNTDILFNDGTAQPTAVLTTATDVIGSIMVLAYSAAFNPVTNGRKHGDSISGSLLFRCTAGNSGQWSGSVRQLGQMGMVSLVPATALNLENRTTAFTIQQFPSGTATWSPCSGTWRALAAVMGSNYDSYANTTSMPSILAIRIA